jgi:hypothetical protein
VVVDPRSGASNLIRPLRAVRVRVTEPSYDAVAAAHGDFVDNNNAGELRHVSDPLLDAAGPSHDRAPLGRGRGVCSARRRWPDGRVPGGGSRAGAVGAADRAAHAEADGVGGGNGPPADVTLDAPDMFGVRYAGDLVRSSITECSTTRPQLDAIIEDFNTVVALGRQPSPWFNEPERRQREMTLASLHGSSWTTN